MSLKSRPDINCRCWLCDLETPGEIGLLERPATFFIGNASFSFPVRDLAAGIRKPFGAIRNSSEDPSVLLDACAKHVCVRERL